MNKPLNTAALLQPISAQRKAGQPLRGTDIFTAIEQEMVSDPEGVVGAKKADWKKARKLSEDALTTKGKDLYVACALVESLYHTEGIEGTAAGLQFLSQFLGGYWSELYPEPDPENADGEATSEGRPPPATAKRERTKVLGALDYSLADKIRVLPITTTPPGRSNGLDSFDWERSLQIKHLKDTDKAAAETAATDSKISPEIFEQAIKATPAQFYFSLKPALETCSAALDELNTLLGERMPDAGAHLSEFRKGLTDCDAAVEAIMLAKGLPVGPPPTGDDLDNKTGSGPLKDPLPGPNPGIASREQALGDLVRIAKFFRDTEPHSPVSYLVLRAEKWARMPLEALFTELIADSGVLDNLKTLLNLKQESVSSE